MTIFNKLFGNHRDRAVANAKKTLSGYDLEKRILEIDLEHNNISRLEYQQALDDLEIKELGKKAHSQQHLEELKLEHSLKQGNISHTDYERELATLRGEPYVNVLNMDVNRENVVQGYIELDWNDEFVKMLTEAGITGTSDDDVVNKWFNGVCRTVLWQEQADLDYGMDSEQGRPDVEYRSESKD